MAKIPRTQRILEDSTVQPFAHLVGYCENVRDSLLWREHLILFG